MNLLSKGLLITLLLIVLPRWGACQLDGHDPKSAAQDSILFENAWESWEAGAYRQANRLLASAKTGCNAYTPAIRSLRGFVLLNLENYDGAEMAFREGLQSCACSNSPALWRSILLPQFLEAVSMRGEVEGLPVYVRALLTLPVEDLLRANLPPATARMARIAVMAKGHCVRNVMSRFRKEDFFSYPMADSIQQKAMEAVATLDSPALRAWLFIQMGNLNTDCSYADGNHFPVADSHYKKAQKSVEDAGLTYHPLYVRSLYLQALAHHVHGEPNTGELYQKAWDAAYLTQSVKGDPVRFLIAPEEMASTVRLFASYASEERWAKKAKPWKMHTESYGQAAFENLAVLCDADNLHEDMMLSRYNMELQVQYGFQALAEFVQTGDSARFFQGIEVMLGYPGFERWRSGVGGMPVNPIQRDLISAGKKMVNLQGKIDEWRMLSHSSAAEADLDQKLQEIQTLSDSIGQLRPSNQVLMETIKAIQAQLSDDERIVATLQGNSGHAIWLLDKTSSQVRTVEGLPGFGLADILAQQIQSLDLDSLQRVASRLGALWGLSSLKHEKETIWYYGGGRSMYFPLELILNQAQAGGSKKKVIYVKSFDRFLSGLEKEAPAMPLGIHILNFEGGRSIASELPSQDRLIRQLKARYSTQSMGEEFSEEEMLEWMTEAQVLHLGGHVFETPWRTSQTGILVGDSKYSRITIEDISKLRIQADLAVIAGCGSGRGGSSHINGPHSLAGALLDQGAKCVVATLWEVDDRATAEIIEGFYHHLSDGSWVSDALWNAKQDFQRKYQGTEYEHPYYWAGIQQFGTDVRITLKKREQSGWGYLLAIIALMDALLLLIGRTFPFGAASRRP